MGCGESKQVATGNTISRKNSRAGSKRRETSETIKETSKADSNTSLLVKEAGKNVIQDSIADNSRAVAESSELKKENVENEEPIEGIAFEGISGRSEYYSPREEAGKESLFNENLKAAEALEDKNLSKETKEETMDEKELAQETKMETKKETAGDKVLAKETKEESMKEVKLAEETKEETVQEIKLAEETKEDTVDVKKLAEHAKEETVEDKKLAEQKKEENVKGEPETVKEENLVKETETAETTEAKVSTLVQKEEEKAAGSAAEDLKTE